jgi:hypothetical protein
MITPEQEKKFARKCARCGHPYGCHSALRAACPSLDENRERVFGEEVFLAIADTTHTNFNAAEEIKNGDLDRLVQFGNRLGAQNTGRVVEVVEAGQLPTFVGLRHITDPRRTPKPRKEVSYVVTTAARGNTPKRAELFWPETATVRFL